MKNGKIFTIQEGKEGKCWQSPPQFVLSRQSDASRMTHAASYVASQKLLGKITA